MSRPPAPPARTSLRIAVAQLRFQPTLDENQRQIAAAIRRAARRGADVVLFPECATTGYHCEFQAIDRTRLQKMLRELGTVAGEARIHVLLGTPWFAGRKPFNSLVQFNREGQAVYRYDKCHLTARDRATFQPGRHLALFDIDGIPATALICHERRFPEVVRLPVMAGARIIFHPNAGLDRLAVSRRKRGGRDGLAARAFENAVPYAFANSVGPQGGGLWSAGDSKLLAADASVLRLAGNTRPQLLVADVDLTHATAVYALEGMATPRFLAPCWREMIRRVRREARRGRLPADALAR